MTPVLVVGAGPTGLTLACELAVRGVPHRLIDAAAGPFAGSRAKGLQPRTLEVFDRLGIVDRIVAAGSVDLPFRQYAEDGGFRDVPRPGLGPRPDVPWPSPILLPQWEAEAALRDRLAALGGHVEYGTTLTDVVAGTDGVRAGLAHARGVESVDPAWLVGCDGGRSTVRDAAGLAFVGETRDDLRMLVGDFRVDGLDRDHWHVWRFASGAFVSMAPLPGSEIFQVQVALGPRETETATLAGFRQVIARRFGEADRFRLSEPTWMSLWRANVRMVDRYRAGRILVAGDAAHVHPPAGGQGMNTGIQDAFNLGWKLAAVVRGAPEALLDTYEAERLPVARGVLALSSRLAATATSASTGGLVARDDDTFQLGIRYRASPLSRDLRATPGRVRAGDRAPDATGLVDGQGVAHRLFDRLRGPRATVLVFGDTPVPVVSGDRVDVVRIAEARDDTTLGDTQGHAAAAWEPGTGALFVVRPDGYVGLAVDPSDAHALPGWLADAGLA